MKMRWIAIALVFAGLVGGPSLASAQYSFGAPSRGGGPSSPNFGGGGY
jgi:hypothetical protein